MDSLHATGASSSYPETMFAVTRTQLSVITWREGVEDPVVEWGQLLAYMPLILKRIASNGHRIFILPKPTLQAANVESATSLIGQLAAELGMSNHQVRHEAREIMRKELRRRGLDRLEQMIDAGER